LRTLSEHRETHGYGNWGIVPHKEDQIIGWAGLQFLPELNETEVGYLLDKPCWGKGLATEAASKSVRYGLEELKLDHIIALVHLENIASQRVIQKCGMTYVETIPIWGIDLTRYRVNRS
jgi:ribosomal-protein-alanine N-acetyltransferase